MKSTKISKRIWTMALRGIALVAVSLAGLLSILGTNGSSSSGDDPPLSFADAGPDRHIEDGVTMLLDGTGSHTPLGADPGDAAVAYEWSVVSAPTLDELPGLPAYILSDENKIIAQFRPRVDPGESGEFTLQLRVRYRGRSAFDSVTLTAHSSEKPPNSDAGPDLLVKHGTLVTLDGSRSDELQNIATVGENFDFQWFIAQQPVGSSPGLSSNDIVNPAFVAEFAEDDSIGRPRYSKYRIGLHTVDATQNMSWPSHVNVYVFRPEGFVYPIPVAEPTQFQRVLTGTTVALDGSASYDLDGRPLSYDWQFYSRPAGSRAVLSGANTATPSFVADREGVYVVQLQVDNGRLSSERRGLFNNPPLGQWSDYRDRVVVIADSESTMPVPNAGPDRVLQYTGPAAIPLDGSASYDADGGEISYNWLLFDAPEGSGAAIQNTMDGVSLLADLEGSYLVGLNAYPFETRSHLDNQVLTLTNNNPPSADAGTDQEVNAGATVMLDGGASTDPDGDPLHYAWSMVQAPDPWGAEGGSGPGWLDWPALSDPRSATTSFTTTQNGTYVLQLTVNDGQFSSAADEVVITVTGSGGNSPPLADAGPDQASAEIGVIVNLDGSGSTDPDGDTLTYQWSFVSRPAGSTATLSDDTTATPSFIPEVAGEYVVRLLVDDGITSSLPDDVTVTVAAAGACSNPLNLLSALPFQPGLGEVATVIRIDGDDLSAVAADIPLDTDAMQAVIPDGSNPNLASFTAPGPNWEIFSRTHPDPVSDTSSPSFVLRQTVGNIYYKIDLDFSGDPDLLEVRIDSLNACNCGNDPGDCPSS